MIQDEIKKKIDQLVTSIGATGEFLGILRESLISNGFTRAEAVYICAQVLASAVEWQVIKENNINECKKD